MVKINNIVCIFLFSFLLLPIMSVAQDVKTSEEQVKQEANRYFSEANYSEAFPLYSQLLSLHPHDYVYNYRFGVCLLISNQDIPRTIDYLKFSLANPKSDILVFYYLGRALQLNYQFDDAISNFNKFKAKASAAQLKKYEVDRQIATCFNAKNLLSNLNDLYVFQKRDVNQRGFFRSYSMTDVSGMVFPLSEDFQSSVDKKKEDDNAVMFMTTKKDKVLFGSYGKADKTGKDIYMSKKDADGKWGDSESLGDVVNTPYDEDYPYLLSDGVTLYFSSKGHNSIGGYDVFKTIYDTTSKAWSTPENLNFAINTPYDDFLFITDTLQKKAYFSSNRTASQDMVTLYKVRVDKRPKSSNVMSLAKAEEIKNSDTATYQAVIKEIRKKSELEVNADEKLLIEDIDVEPEIAAIDVVNVERESNRQRRKAYEFKKYPEVEINENSTTADILNAAQIDALRLQDEATELKYKAEAAVAVAEDKKLLANQKNSEAEMLMEQESNITDSEMKRLNREKVIALRKEAVELRKEAAIAFEIAQDLDVSVKSKEKEAVEAAQFSTDLEKAINSKSPEQALALLDEYNSKLDSNYVNYDEEVLSQQSPNQQDYSEKLTEVETARKQYDKVNSDYQNLKAEAQKMRADAAATRKKETKDMLENQAKLLDEEALALEPRIAVAKSELDMKQAEADSVFAALSVITNLFAEIKTSADSTITIAYSAQDNSKTAIEQRYENLEKISAEERPVGEETVANAEAVKSEPKEAESTTATSAKYSEMLVKVDESNSVAVASLKKIEDISNAALFIADERQKKSSELLTKAENATGSEAENYKVQAKKANEEALAAMDVYYELKKDNEAVGRIVDEMKSQQSELKTAVEQDNYDAAVSVFNSQQQIASDNASKIQANVSVEQVLKDKATSLMEEASAKSEKVMIVESEIADMNKEVSQLNTELEGKVPNKRKAEINSRLTEVKNTLETKGSEVAMMRSEAEKLNARSDAYDKRVLAGSFASDIQEKSVNISGEEVASIDKSNLTDNTNRVSDYFATQEPQLAMNRTEEQKEKGVESEQQARESEITVNRTESNELKTEESEVVRKKVTKEAEIAAKQAKTQELTTEEQEIVKEKELRDAQIAAKQANSQELTAEEKEVVRQQQQQQQQQVKSEAVSNQGASSERGLSLEEKESIRQQVAREVAISVKQANSQSLTAEELDIIRAKEARESLIAEKQANSQALTAEELEYVKQKQIIESELASNQGASSASGLSSEEKESIKQQVAREAAISVKLANSQSLTAEELDIVRAKEARESLIAEKQANSQTLTTEELEYVKQKQIIESELASNQGASSASGLSSEEKESIRQQVAREAAISVKLANSQSLTAEELDIVRAKEARESLIAEKQANSLALTAEELEYVKQKQAMESELASNQKEAKEVTSESNEIERQHKAQEQEITAQEQVKRQEAVAVAEKKEVPVLLTEEEMLTVELQEIEVRSQTMRKRYEENKEKLTSVRISSQDSKATEVYADINAIRNAEQLEQQSDEYFAKVEASENAAATENSPKEKRNLLAQAEQMRNVAVENQNKALDIYLQTRRSAAIAKKAPGSEIVAGEALAVVPESEYETNKSKLASADKSNLNSEVNSQAMSMVEEAENYYIAAAQRMEEANNAANEEQKTQLVQMAKANEMYAMESQQLALTSIEKNELQPGYISSTGTLVAQAPIQPKVSESKAVEPRQVKAAEISEVKAVKPVVAERKSISQPIAGKEVVVNSSIAEMNTEGLVFKVQLAAFKGEARLSMFNGLSPMSKEETPTGFTRYMVGVYDALEIASSEKVELRGRGFAEAFVVAYLNGKRITIKEAKAMLEAGEAKAAAVTTAKVQYNTSKIYGVPMPTAIEAPSADLKLTGTDIITQQGLVYTVQAGVFSRPVNMSQMFNLGNVYYEQLPGGRVRYLSGAFATRQEASVQKPTVVSKGIKDAFVVAYFNGKKITLDEAAKMESVK